MSEIWTIKRTLEWTTGYLENHGDAHARLSAQMLIGHCCKLSRIELYMDIDRPLDKDELNELHCCIERRSKGEPIQYIIGSTGFRTLDILLKPGVLIPRPETELLVQCGIDFIQANRLRNVHVLDLCCGSGCIACSLASEVAEIEVVAADIDERAIDVTRLNVDNLGLSEKITIMQSDMFSSFNDSFSHYFNVILSNPPYIPQDVLSHLDSEVLKFEPMRALDGGLDGLDFFRHILIEAKRFLADGGLLACELHEDCLETAHHLALNAGYDDVQILNDLAGKPRIIAMRFNS